MCYNKTRDTATFISHSGLVNTMVRLMSDDRSLDTESLRQRVTRYLRSSANHREKIPFLFVDYYAGVLPEEPPDWVAGQSDLSLYWEISDVLSTLYSCPVQESFGKQSRVLDHAERYETADVKPDHRLYQLSRETDLTYKDWCRNMETYLRERGVKSDP